MLCGFCALLLRRHQFTFVKGNAESQQLCNVAGLLTVSNNAKFHKLMRVSSCATLPDC